VSYVNRKILRSVIFFFSKIQTLSGFDKPAIYGVHYSTQMVKVLLFVYWSLLLERSMKWRQLLF